MRRYMLPFLAGLMVIVLALVLPVSPPSQAPGDESASQASPKGKGSGVVTPRSGSPFPKANRPSIASLPPPVVIEGEESVSWARLKEDPDYRLRVARHMQLRYYMRSPARETPECEGVRLALAQHGLGLEAVPDAYNLAWEYHHHLQKVDPGGAGQAEVERHESMRNYLLNESWQRFKHKYGVTNNALFEAISANVPQVFFGTYNTSLPEGERLYICSP